MRFKCTSQVSFNHDTFLRSWGEWDWYWDVESVYVRVAEFVWIEVWVGDIEREPP